MFKSIEVKKLIDPYVDLGNLLLIDRDPLGNEESSSKVELGEDVLLELTRNNSQYLFNEIWKLPRKNVDQTICAQLPEVTYTLPREKPIPLPRQPTKWEAFAKAKGIVKHKKDSKIYDETTSEWKPRYGYRSAPNDKAHKDWLIEIPRQKDPYKNYFEERKQKKTDQTDKYDYQHLKNVARSMKAAGGSGSNFTPIGKRIESTNINNPENRKVEFKKQTQELTKKIYHAKVATASVGKFQESIKGEKKPKLGEKRKFESNEANTKSERQHQLEILTKFQAKKPKLAPAKFNAAHQASKDGDNDDKRQNRRSAGKNNRRSAAGDFHKNSKSNQNRQKHFNMIKKGGKNRNSKPSRVQTKKGNK